MKLSKTIALDADGVLLNYNLAYAAAWERAFGLAPALKNAQAYWAVDRWDVQHLEGEPLQRFRASFDRDFWSSVPAMAGAVQACHRLVAAGWELVCVSALKPEFAQARQDNLSQLGFPIGRVIATSGAVPGGSSISPKARALAELAPAAFVDDYLPYFQGVSAHIHKALVLREPQGSPNTGPGMQAIDSTHGYLAEFVDWWLENQPQ
ncbi:HAD family hydrolase [Comamonas sp. GB3 AK4-5]|uniref:HAD family hydrolase n=1 Tax=Comamonas sp. GB3 AK4-5 TaxID=3231487 RepID=UPI00351E6923